MKYIVTIGINLLRTFLIIGLKKKASGNIAARVRNIMSKKKKFRHTAPRRLYSGFLILQMFTYYISSYAT